MNQSYLWVLSNLSLSRLRQMLLDDLQVHAEFCETSEERRRRGAEAAEED